MSSKFVVNVRNSDLAQCLKQLSAFDGKSRLGVEQAMANAVRRIKSGAVRRVAVASGKLKKSIRSSFSKPKLLGIVRARAPHAHLVEFGAKGATVKPKRKKALRLAVADGYKFMRKAKIPERKSRPFIMPAYEAEKGKLIADVKAVIRKGR